MKITCSDPLALAKEMFWLAWNACGGPSGMGWLQDAPSATRDDIWNNIVGAGDYPGQFRSQPDIRPYADYVFGRMMKFGVEIEEDGVSFRDTELRSDYQAWCRVYKTMEDLANAAQESLEKK